MTVAVLLCLHISPPQVNEPGDHKNDCKDGSFVCVPPNSPFNFEYSWAGKPSTAKQCIGFADLPLKDETAKKMWSNNFLCTKKPLDIVLHGG